MSWKDNTYSLKELEGYVEQFERSPLRQKTFILSFLVWTGVISGDIKWARGNSLTRTSLDPLAIKAGYLAELAHDWDKDGMTTPREFLESLEYEVAGHARNEAVSEVLGGLGR